MVAFLPALSALVGLFLGVQLLKPRLPTYSFRVQRLVPRFVHSKLKASLGSKVKLTNDNFVHIDIHALSFDLFYPDWQGRLNHIGHVHDSQQSPNNDQDENSSNGISDAIMSNSPPLWALSPRKSFETTDEVLMQPAGLSWDTFRTMSNLSWDIVTRSMQLEVPSSGVIHVKANSRIPLTLSILCDNLMDITTLEMQGVKCELHTMDLGWQNLSNTAQKLRTVVQSTKPSDQILEGDGKSVSESFEEQYQMLVKRLEWKEAIPILSL